MEQIPPKLGGLPRRKLTISVSVGPKSRCGLAGSSGLQGFHQAAVQTPAGISVSRPGTRGSGLLVGDNSFLTHGSLHGAAHSMAMGFPQRQWEGTLGKREGETERERERASVRARRRQQHGSSSFCKLSLELESLFTFLLYSFC